MTDKVLLATVSARPRFPIGCLVITRNALDLLNEAEVSQGLSRHIIGDWGNVPADGPAVQRRCPDSRRPPAIGLWRRGTPVLDHHRSRPLCNNHSYAG